MKRSRTTNSFINFLTGIGGQLMVSVIDFVVRTVFIHTLGKVYLGINGLFSNILTMLSLAELGMGSAILFKLYEPLAHNDTKRLAVLMKFYKRIYTVIGLVVAVVGALLIPYLPKIINGYEKYANLNLNLSIVYLLFLFRTVSTYIFFAYRSAIIKANQQEYIVNLINIAVSIVSALISIASLYLLYRVDQTLCFIIYVLIGIVSNLFKNILYAYKSNKLFPFLKEPCADSITKEEEKNIYKDCGALFLYKINTVVVKGTDNIVISYFLGIETLAIYSNYYLFFQMISSYTQRFFGAMAHSIGNLHADGNESRQYQVFNELHLLAAIIAATSMVGLATVGDTAIRAWIGSEWTFGSGQPVALLIGIESYALAYTQLLSRHRHAMGLFRQAKWRPLIGMIINVIVSIVMVRIWGVCGVLFGTIIADWTTKLWYDPIIIFKYGFNRPQKIRTYFKDYVKYFLTACFVFVSCKLLFSVFLPNNGWISMIVHTLLCIIITPLAILAVAWKTPERKAIINLAKKYLSIIKSGIQKKNRK